MRFTLKLRYWATCFVIFVLVGILSGCWAVYKIYHIHIHTLEAEQLRQKTLDITANLMQETRQLSILVRAYTATAESQYRIPHKVKKNLTKS